MSTARRDVDTGDGANDVLVATDGDPTRTQTVEERYAQALRGGYQRLNALIRESVGERDVLGLGSAELFAAEPPPDFSFTRDDRKVEGFREWLDRAQEDEALEVVTRGENRYVRQAYETGVRGANADIRKGGIGEPQAAVEATLRQPVHERTLQLLYTRNFNELQGMTDDVGREVARELSQALAEGAGPREAERRIRDVIGTIDDGTPRGAMARATTIARTEILRARHVSAAEQYERFGVERVEPILAPTACPICVDIAAGAPYPVDEMRALLPAHPNCRCSWTIVTDRQLVASANVFSVPVHRAEAFASAGVPMTPGRIHATAA